MNFDNSVNLLVLHFLDNCVRIIYIQGHGIPWSFPTLYVEIPYLINIHGQYINIHEVTDFHGGFSIFIQYMCRKYLMVP